MLKSDAIRLLGGTQKSAAEALDISPSAVSQWPDELTPDIENRVLAHLARKHLPPEILSGEAPPATAPTSPAEPERDPGVPHDNRSDNESFGTASGDMLGRDKDKRRLSSRSGD